MKQVEEIVKAISLLDFDLVETLLDDVGNLHPDRKADFLNKLMDAFERFISEGEKYLYRAKGIYVRADYSPKEPLGYYFVGNSSNHRFGLVIISSDLGIENLFFCPVYMISVSDDYLQNAIDSDHYFDEEDEFISTPEYLILSQHCKNAIQEIYDLGNEFTDINFYYDWIKKHEDLNKSLPRPVPLYRNLTLFNEMYSPLEDLPVLPEMEDEAQIAMEEFNNVLVTDDKELAIWILKNEALNEQGFSLTLASIYKDGMMIEDFVYGFTHKLKISLCSYPHSFSFFKFYEYFERYLLLKYMKVTEEKGLANDIGVGDLHDLAFQLKLHGII